VFVIIGTANTITHIDAHFQCKTSICDLRSTKYVNWW